jgi:hypothetical protein
MIKKKVNEGLNLSPFKHQWIKRDNQLKVEGKLL